MNSCYTVDDYREMFLACGFDVPKGNKGQVSCPNHEDKHPSMSIDLTRGLFYCFSCGDGRGTNIRERYWQLFGHGFEKDKCTDAEGLRKLIAARQKPKIYNSEKQFFKIEAEKSNMPILKEWLKYRGISLAVADAAGVFYGTAHITYKNDEGKEKTYHVRDRVMFPIYDKNKQLTSLEMRFPFFGTESERFKQTVAKVLYPKCSSVNLLYEQYKLDEGKKLYVLEGLMDCLAFKSLTGLRNATSIFGAQFTNHQKDLLSKFPEICYVYNNDKAGLESVEKMKNFYKGKLTLLKPMGNYDDVGDMAKAHVTGVQEWLTQERLSLS